MSSSGSYAAATPRRWRARADVAIEVKSAATVRAEDFRGIDHLASRLGDDLVVGIVLYTGVTTLSFGPKKLAVPVSALWELSR